MSAATQNSPKDPAKSSRKASKTAKKRKPKSAEPEMVALPEKTASAFPVFDLSETPTSPQSVPAATVSPEATVAPTDSAPSMDWPEQEPASSDDAAVPGNPKRKRRRKKGKGGQSNGSQTPPANEPPAGTAADMAPPASHLSQPRHKLDTDGVAKLAWKIYLAEVSEEGVALIGDNDAKELSRRCFRLAEIFMEEQSRRR